MWDSIVPDDSLHQVTTLTDGNLLLKCGRLLVVFCRFNWDMSIDEAVELARRSIYHATFRDGASGGVASGKRCWSLSLVGR